MKSGPNSTVRLLLKEAGAEKGSGLAGLEKKGNLGVEQIIKIAKQRMDSMYSYDLKTAVKETAGACMPMGLLCEGMSPKEFAEKVDEGVYDKEIKSEKTELSEEKKQKLKQELEEVNERLAPELQALKKERELKALKRAKREASSTLALPGSEEEPDIEGEIIPEEGVEKPEQVVEKDEEEKEEE